MILRQANTNCWCDTTYTILIVAFLKLKLKTFNRIIYSLSYVVEIYSDLLFSAVFTSPLSNIKSPISVVLTRICLLRNSLSEHYEDTDYAGPDEVFEWVNPLHLYGQRPWNIGASRLLQTTICSRRTTTVFGRVFRHSIRHAWSTTYTYLLY